MSDDLCDALLAADGVGSVLAERVGESLGLDTTDDLRAALDDGRLNTVEGVGPATVWAVRQALGLAPPPDEPPPVAEILDIDREYRRRADADDLPRIAPHAHNPDGEAWLPILTTTRAHGAYTALFSNTGRAHDAGATDDWVVIYQDRPDRDRQWTVVTEAGGPRDGRRVVRGREDEAPADDP